MAVQVAPPAPPVERGRGGGGSDWVELLTAPNEIDAHLLVGRLTEDGVATKTIVDRTTPGAWLFGASLPWAPVTVFVRRFQLDDARIVLAEIAVGLDSPDQEEAGRRRGFGLLWWSLALALGALFTLLSLAHSAERLDGLERCRATGDCRVEARP
jgi:hypothetical protein